MGPAILFDKSAIEGLGVPAVEEVSRYFYTTVPQVLLNETLADMKFKKGDIEDARKRVAVLAKKIFPMSAIVNTDYRSLCLHNLMGEFVPMKSRTPVVCGAKQAMASDGSVGLFIDVQPENEAILQWRNGKFSESDLNYALEWREALAAINFEEAKKELPKPPVRVTSLEILDAFVKLLLEDDDTKTPMLRYWLRCLRCDEEMRKSIEFRWELNIRRHLPSFAPYAFHCLRIRCLYLIGMMNGLFGTRNSNIVDIEYLYYSPFTSIFCSGDDLHQQMAQLVFQDDQTFLTRTELQGGLAKIVETRKANADYLPTGETLVGKLWLKHWQRLPIDPKGRILTQEEVERYKPIIEALREIPTQPGQRFPVE